MKIFATSRLEALPGVSSDYYKIHRNRVELKSKEFIDSVKDLLNVDKKVIVVVHQKLVRAVSDEFRYKCSLLDGNVFVAQVGYDRSTHIKGHGWAFNGKSAWKSVGERWRNETSRWVGSNYLCFTCRITFVNNPFSYNHHEEQYITNTNDTLFLNYNASVLALDPIRTCQNLYENRLMLTRVR